MPDAIEQSVGHWKILRGSVPYYIFVNGGRRCSGTVILDGQKWGVIEGNKYHRIIENYEDGK
jgi:hypothetical protein